MFDIGLQELVVIFVIALIVFGLDTEDSERF